MVSVTLTLRPSDIKKDGTCPVLLRITENRKSRWAQTGVSIKQADWNPKRGEVRKSHPLYAVFNATLQEKKNDALAASHASRPSGTSASETVLAKLRGQDGTEVYAFTDTFAERLLIQKRFSGWKRTMVIAKKLRRFMKDRPLTFEQIDGDFLARFERHLREDLGNGSSTIAKDFQGLRRVLKEAMKAKLFDGRSDPFYGYKIAPGKKTAKTKLSFEQVQALEALDLNSRPALALTRDAFLFSFYCAGIRFGDMCQLQWLNVSGGRLRYQMSKTGKPRSLKLLPQAEEILSRYRKPKSKSEDLIFPLLTPGKDYSDPIFVRRCIGSKNVIANANLKRLAKLAEIEEHVSFHVSRHSFADFARRKNTNVYDISNMLGHHSLKVTERYLAEFDEESMDEALDRMFSP
jgi:integrase